MAKELLNEISVQQLYDYPETGLLKKNLCFLVYSIEKKKTIFYM